MATTAEQNLYKAQARAAKVARLAVTARAVGATADVLRAEPEVRDRLVAAANVRKPSDETWEALYAELDRPLPTVEEVDAMLNVASAGAWLETLV